ncbi:MAG: hypothetical protein KGN80_11785 [Acidobacteriota bacterium]|nr:hypothetical protein [Acidobacteriota bacterium]
MKKFIDAIRSHAGFSSMILLLFISPEVFAQKPKEKAVPKSISPSSTYLIQGVLLSQDHSPLVGQKVFVLKMATDQGPAVLPGGAQAIRHSTTLSYKMDNDRKIVNPCADTDSLGHFSISVDLAFLRHWQIPTDSLVLAVKQGENFTMLIKPDASPAQINLDKKNSINLGNVHPEPKH